MRTLELNGRLYTLPDEGLIAVRGKSIFIDDKLFTPVFKGSLGCLTDDCEYWDCSADLVCKRLVPCKIGRSLDGASQPATTVLLHFVAKLVHYEGTGVVAKAIDEAKEAQRKGATVAQDPDLERYIRRLEEQLT